ncbi:hypothetical protein [Aliidiomarina minuta]|uniref:hypothetical protein n=1 Tax=Aliidiomarina minuta TaxID=880057 RepID=UPI000F88AADB|nr:hypothetical protein [Aliidiomarina minuta]
MYNAGPPEDDVPLFDDDDAFLDPVTLDYIPSAERAYRYRINQILWERERLGVSMLHEDYPLIPGCVPVQGVERLPAADRSHHLASRGVCFPGQWIDSFFAEEDSLPYAARTLVRAMYFSRWQENEGYVGGTRVDGHISLNNISDRLSLILRSADKDDDLLRERLDVESPDDRGKARAAVRFATALGRQASSRTDVGIRGSTPFVRTRFRYNQPLIWGVHGRFNQEFYWRGNDERRGVVSELQMGRRLTGNTTLRATSTIESNTALRAQDVLWQWSHSVSHFWRLAHRTGLHTLVRVNGKYQEQHKVQSYQYSMRFRSSLLRPWIYYEVEPFALQKRENNFSTSPGIMFRFEVQFGDYH